MENRIFRHIAAKQGETWIISLTLKFPMMTSHANTAHKWGYDHEPLLSNIIIARQWKHNVVRQFGKGPYLLNAGQNYK